MRKKIEKICCDRCYKEITFNEPFYHIKTDLILNTNSQLMLNGDYCFECLQKACDDLKYMSPKVVDKWQNVYSTLGGERRIKNGI
jgi:hypothetical protein